MTLSTPSPRLPTVLEELRTVDTKLHSLDADRAAAIRKARSEGATWTQIGEAMGITKQAAWERFRALDVKQAS